MLSGAERRFVESMRVARLATADANGAPHVVPVCYALVGDNLYVTIDEKPKRAGVRAMKRLRNIEENPSAAVVVDRYDDDWSRLAWVMLRGRAEILDDGDEHDRAQAALRERYPQYRAMRLEPLPVIVLRIGRVNAWGVLAAPADESGAGSGSLIGQAATGAREPDGSDQRGAIRHGATAERGRAGRTGELTMPVTDIHAVVPVKNLGNAKRRLATVLDQRARTALFRAMLEDVLEALAGAASLAGIVLVTRDEEAMALARRYGAECLVEPENRGHTAAVEFAAKALAARGAEALLQVPGDIPRVTSEEIEAVIAAHAPAPAVTIAPSRDHRGSNAVLCSPPDVFPFRFGDDSYFPHLAAARAVGIEPTVVERAGIGLDIDTPDDLEAFLASPSDTRAYRLLAGRDAG